MTIEHRAGGASFLDVLDRVLETGIVIDVWKRVSLGGVNLMEVEARMVVASINTYLTSAHAVAELNMASPPRLTEPVRTFRRRRVRQAPYRYPRAA